MHLRQPRPPGAKTPVPIPTKRSSEAAIRHLADRDLEELRRRERWRTSRPDAA
jgi:hypothetical protein